MAQETVATDSPDPGRPRPLGSRLRALRRAAGLSQVQLVSRMGRRGKGASNLVSRLESGKVEHPTLRVLTDYLSACGASFAAVADLLGTGAAMPPAPDKPTIAETGTKRKAGPRTPEQKLAQFRRDASRTMRGVVLEEILYDFLKNSGVADRYEDQKALAGHGRAYFRSLLRLNRSTERLRARTTKAARLSPEQLSSVETVVQRTFDVMRAGGDLAPAIPVDDRMILEGKARIRRVRRAEERLADDLQAEISTWAGKRSGVTDTIRRDYMDVLRKTGMTEHEAGRYASFVSELCSRAEETEADPARRAQAGEEFIARARDKDKARAMVEYAFSRWDELKNRIPPRPRVITDRGKR